MMWLEYLEPLVRGMNLVGLHDIEAVTISHDYRDNEFLIRLSIRPDYNLSWRLPINSNHSPEEADHYYEYQGQNLARKILGELGHEILLFDEQQAKARQRRSSSSRLQSERSDQRRHLMWPPAFDFPPGR